MRTTPTLLVASVAAAAALVVACGSHDTQCNPNTAQSPAQGAERLGVTAAQNGFDLESVDLIADARCDRAEQCNEIGFGRRYASRAQCDEQKGSSTSYELNATSCPRGVDHDAVSRCVTAINRQACPLPLESLSRIADCRIDVLCVM